MGYGARDSFAENVGDYLLDDYDSSINMGMEKAPRRRRKTKKRRTMARRSHKKVRHSRSRKPSAVGRSTHKKRRKGMSKEFLRQLRKKHHLGEFKRS